MRLVRAFLPQPPAYSSDALRRGSLTRISNMIEAMAPTIATTRNAVLCDIYAVTLNRMPIESTSPMTYPTPIKDAAFPMESLCI